MRKARPTPVASSPSVVPPEVNAPVIYLNQVGGQDRPRLRRRQLVVERRRHAYRTQPGVHGKPDVLGLRFRRRTSGQGRDRSGTRPGRRGLHRLRARPQGLHGQEPLHRRDAGPLRRHRLRTWLHAAWRPAHPAARTSRGISMPSVCSSDGSTKTTPPTLASNIGAHYEVQPIEPSGQRLPTSDLTSMASAAEERCRPASAV